MFQSPTSSSRYFKMQTASVVPHSQLIQVQTRQPATHALLHLSPTFPDLSLTITLPAYASPCSFTILGLGPRYPLLPQSECRPSSTPTTISTNLPASEVQLKYHLFPEAFSHPQIELDATNLCTKPRAL